jgi:hypothetical protein
MIKASAILLIGALLAACVPPWPAAQCDGQPNFSGLSDVERNAKIAALTDQALLDYAACRVVSRHPPGIDFPSDLVTSRSSSMALLLLDRVERRDEGLISMQYMFLLSDMVSAHPEWLSPQQMDSASGACTRLLDASNRHCYAFRR